MTTALTDLLRSIPESVRKILLWGFVLAAALVWLGHFFEIDHIGNVTIDYAKLAVLGSIIGPYLGLQSAANVGASVPDGKEPNDETVPVVGEADVDSVAPSTYFENEH